MTTLGGPIGAAAYVILLWWGFTGAAFWLHRRAGIGRAALLGLATLVAAFCLGLAVVTAGDPTPRGALIAFTAALGLWSWHELSFLLGFVTGPRRAACPPGARGLRRFRLATATVIFHEAALAATLAALVIWLARAPNPVAAWTFATLFAARLLAKLNLFVGVPHFSADLFPERLRHLASYLRQAPSGGLLALTLVGLAAASGLEAADAFAGDAAPFRASASGLLFALTALALIEHLFMIIPIPERVLWGWALAAGGKGDRPTASAPAARSAALRPERSEGVPLHGL